MTRKRKRSAHVQDHSSYTSSKCQKLASPRSNFEYSLLKLYYPKVSSLREYLLSRFPASSRARKQRLQSVSTWNEQLVESRKNFGRDSEKLRVGKIDYESQELVNLSKLLDTAVVGYGEEGELLAQDSIAKNLECLSGSLKSSISSTNGNNRFAQGQVGNCHRRICRDLTVI
jgi:hypothetical protein